MKIGYPCINQSIGCTTNTTFRLANYSEENLILKVNNNLSCLRKILEFNKKNNLLFFRISSDIIPFAGHPICKFNWRKYFKKDLDEIGEYIISNKMRISMHPDQFVLINSLRDDVIEKSIAELKWHCEFLDSLSLLDDAKVQIHIGGVYNDKKRAIERFIKNYNKLSGKIKKRLVIENDDKLFSLQDCLFVSQKTSIPVLFDSFHHTCLKNGESFLEAIKLASKTWLKKDGILMTDYSSQDPGERKGKHVKSIDLKDFESYINLTKSIDFDIMLEIKDKEKSALKALTYLN